MSIAKLPGKFSALLFCLFILLPYNIYARQDDLSALLQQTDALKKQHPDSAYMLLKQVLYKAREEKNITTEAIALQQTAYIFFHHGSYSQALEHYLQADKLFRQTNRKDLLADNLDDIGNMYYSNREKDVALRYYKEALKLYEQTNDTSGKATTYGMIGHIWEKNSKYDSAFYYQRLALQYYILLKDTHGISDIYENIASIFEDLEQFDSSYTYYNKALQLYVQNGDVMAQIGLRNNLGDIYRKTGHFRQGLAQTRIALQMAEQTEEPFQINSAYSDIAKAYRLMHINDSAYYYDSLSRKQLLKIYSIENSKQIAFLQAIFDIEHKNNEIQRLESTRKTQRITTIAIAIVLPLLLLLGTVIISRQRLKIRTQHAISEQEKKVYETRHALIQTELQNKKLQEDNLRQELEARSRELTSHTLHVIQKNQLLEDLKTKLEELLRDDKRDHKKQMKQVLQQINQNFNQDKYWDELRVIFEQVHQSFFENIKKHADDLTAAELRLATLLKINLNSSDIATLLGISQDSLRIARYRLRKKLKLEVGANLTSFIQSL